MYNAIKSKFCFGGRPGGKAATTSMAHRKLASFMSFKGRTIHKNTRPEGWTLQHQIARVVCHTFNEYKPRGLGGAFNKDLRTGRCPTLFVTTRN